MPHKPLLNDMARDIISLVSLVVSLVGFGVTIWQLRKTRSAADAAKRSAELALEESRNKFRKYVFANVLRLLSEARLHGENRVWERAAVRLNDLADQVSQLSDADEEWAELLSRLRAWNEVLLDPTRRDKPATQKKWAELITRVQSKIDREHGPFRR